MQTKCSNNSMVEFSLDYCFLLKVVYCLKYVYSLTSKMSTGNELKPFLVQMKLFFYSLFKIQ